MTFVILVILFVLIFFGIGIAAWHKEKDD